MPSRSRLLFIPVLLTAILAGCGSGGGNDKQATQLLNTAFHRSIKSADVNFNLQVQVNGVSSLRAPISLRFSGPYSSNGKGKLPSFDFDANLAGGGQNAVFGLTSTGDDLFVKASGQAYDVGKATVARLNRQLQAQKSKGPNTPLSELGIHPSTWLTDAKLVGDDNVAGTPVSHVSGALHVGKLLDDLSQLVKKAPTTSVSGSKPPQLSDKQKSDIEKAVKNSQIDVFVAKTDHTIRRLAGTIEISIPKDQQSQFGGATGATLRISLDLANVGQPKTIHAPANAKPISDLTGQLNALGGNLGGGSSSNGGSSNGSGSSGSSGNTPTAKQFQKYAQCLQKAGGNDPSALQKCSDLLK